MAGVQVKQWMAPAALADIGMPTVRCRAGSRWQWDGVRFEILHPREILPQRSNNRSCVLSIEGPSWRYLLAGDIERSVELELAARFGPALQTDLLLVPHHGSHSSSSHDFTWFSRPTVAVASVGYGNRFGHPAPVVADRYRDLGSALVTTAEAGALHFDGSGSYRPFRWFYTRYWQHYPCYLAGSARRSWLLHGLDRLSIALPGCELAPVKAVDSAIVW
jgi:competence protein ComEC